jgi:hypothetical protein
MKPKKPKKALKKPTRPKRPKVKPYSINNIRHSSTGPDPVYYNGKLIEFNEEDQIID